MNETVARALAQALSGGGSQPATLAELRLRHAALVEIKAAGEFECGMVCFLERRPMDDTALPTCLPMDTH